MAALSPTHRSRRPPLNIATLVLAVPLLLLLAVSLHNNILLHSSQQAVHQGGGDPLSLPGPAGGSGAPAERNLTAEVWAGFAPAELSSQREEVLKLLTDQEKTNLEELCGRCLFEQLKMTIGYGNGHKVGAAAVCLALHWLLALMLPCVLVLVPSTQS